MASLCSALTEITKDCLNNMGGIQQVLINDKADIDSVTLTNDEVTAIGLDAISPVYFKKYEFTRDSSFFTETPEIDTTAGTTLYAQSLSMSFKRRDLDKRNSIQLLAAGQRDLIAAVQDNNRQWWLMGYALDFDQGLQLTGAEGGSGTAKADMNGYVLELSNQFPTMMHPIDDAVIATILAP